MPALVALTPPQPQETCCCSSGKPFGNCCGPIIDGTKKAETAEQLMRARFSAHVVKNEKFLHETYAPSARVPFVAEPHESTIGWTRLVVHSHELGATPDVAFVEFSAYFFEGESPEQVLQEKAEFKRNDGAWLFTRTVRQGPAPHKSSAPKVGRNDPCPCGSGKKYKQCCLGKA